MLTVAIDTGETLIYLDVPASGVAEVAAASGGDLVAVAQPGTVTIEADWPNDTFARYQWAIPAAGFDAVPGRASGTGIIVAILDTGVRADHEDLTSNVIDGGPPPPGKGS